MLPPVPSEPRKPRIVLADDEAIIAMQLEELVEAEGYEVAGVAGTAAQALEMATTLKPDLVIMDIVMPGDMDGIDACAIIQRELNIPVVLLSAHGEEHFLRRARSALPSAYLIKPCQNTQVRAAIEVALAMRAHTDPAAGFRLREAHHRIKNSFSLLHGILRLQQTQVNEAQAKEALADAGARVLAMSRAHEAMSGKGDGKMDNAGEYVRRLAQSLFEAQRPLDGEARCQLVVDTAPVVLDHAKFVPCGIFLAEAMTNALKYAFPEGRAGTVRVELSQDNGDARLLVADDGAGLPDSLEELGRHSFGLQCLQAAAVQLGGVLAVASEPDKGSEFSVRFPRI
jgi:two-component sensor histidine kinase